MLCPLLAASLVSCWPLLVAWPLLIAGPLLDVPSLLGDGAATDRVVSLHDGQGRSPAEHERVGVITFSESAQLLLGHSEVLQEHNEVLQRRNEVLQGHNEIKQRQGLNPVIDAIVYLAILFITAGTWDSEMAWR